MPISYISFRSQDCFPSPWCRRFIFWCQSNIIKTGLRNGTHLQKKAIIKEVLYTSACIYHIMILVEGGKDCSPLTPSCASCNKTTLKSIQGDFMTSKSPISFPPHQTSGIIPICSSSSPPCPSLTMKNLSRPIGMAQATLNQKRSDVQSSHATGQRACWLRLKKK